MEPAAKQTAEIPWQRRLFRFSLRRLMLLVLLCAIGLGWPHIWRLIQFQRLKSYAGQDLRQLGEADAKTFAGIARTLWTDNYPANPFISIEPEPWYVWQTVAANGEPLTILFGGLHIYSIPGESRARICVFGRYGRKLSDITFSTGWRIDIVDAGWEPADRHGFDCIKISTTPEINGADIATQYYALIDHEFALVRSEDSQGHELDNNYHNPNHTLGPGAPHRSADGWAAALGSANRGEVLRTLVWLGGSHSDPPIADQRDIGVEPFEDAVLVGQVRSRADVRAALERLAADADPWVSQTAQAAIAAIADP
jgi:hypothetical protein